MNNTENVTSRTRIPLVSGAVIAVGRRPWLAYVLALLALVAVGICAYFLVQVQSDLQQQLKQQSTLEARLDEAANQQRQLRDELTQRGRQLDEAEARLARWDEALNNSQRRVWVLNETGFYLRLAQQHLLLSRDLQGARALLDVIDKLLAQQSDNSLLPLRDAIARDRLALASSGGDSTGVYLRISALADRLTALKLPVIPDTAPINVIPEPLPVSSSASFWEKAWARLQQLVVVRRHDAPLQPLLNDGEQALVREALRIDLAQAQFALLRADAHIYSASLQAVADRLNRHFILLPPKELASLQEELSALQAIDARPVLPDLSASLNALQALTPQETASGSPAL